MSSSRVRRRVLSRSAVFTSRTAICTIAIVVLPGVGRSTAAANDSEAVASRIPAADAVRVQFRVTDSAGRPVPDARVRLLKLASQEQTATEPVAGRSQAPAVTNADGLFRTADPLPAGTAYVAEIIAEGYVPGLSRWTRPADRGDIELPEVVLPKLVSVAGRVVNREGKPLAGVRLFQSGDAPERTEAVTDADGRFRLGGLPEGGGFVFAEKAGFRFHGQRVDARDGVGDIILETHDSPTRRVLRPTALARPSIPEAQAKAWAEQVRKSRFEQIVSGEATSFSFVDQLSQTHPELLLERINELAAAFPHLGRPRELFLNLAAIGIAEADFDEAQALSRLANRSSIGARGGSNVLLPWSDGLTREAKRAALSEGAVIARQLSDVRSQIAYLTMFASLLIELAEHEQAKPLLEEVEHQIASLPPDAPTTRGYRGRLAAFWAPVDLPKALSLMERAEPASYIDVAAVLAREQPSDAERVLKTAAPRIESNGPARRIARRELPRICFRMALSDPQRAQRVARRMLEPALQKHRVAALSVAQEAPISGELKEQLDLLLRQAFVEGLIVEAVARTNPAKARAYLEKAVETVLPLRHGSYEDGSGLFFVTPALVLSTLLPLAERIDPAWGRELFWRTLAARLPPPEGESERRQMHDCSLGFLALMLSRYDREIAKDILQPVLVREQSRALNGTIPYRWPATVCVLIDPDGAAQWIDTLPEEPDGSGLSPRARAQEILA
ncbi:MAG TPA: carboxypeptidase-like regulatory domain-containing protein, partial [Planctomycetaceae bacterium]|nr:carboxypeptidase-like regulatory domain-containing protein [Planctomycetaceae bacterium]